MTKRTALLASCVLFSTICIAQELSKDIRPVVVMIDYVNNRFVYEVDSVPVRLPDILERLFRKMGTEPSSNPHVIVLAHEKTTFEMIENMRGIVTKVGYDWPRIFYFDKKKRVMIEVTPSRGVPFSTTGEVPAERQ